jgi:hypothetical protein
MNWQPIDTAPKDTDNPILTEEGFVVWTAIKYVLRMDEAWCICDSSGQPYRCADEGYFYCSPRWWMPIPSLPSKPL